MASLAHHLNIPTNEFDYVLLRDLTKGYRYPRNKIGRMLRNGEIVRVKKGIYTKGGAPHHPFILANMIYGPSYVSQDSALAYYGLIPEQVIAITSVAFSKTKNFDTPVGRFSYEAMPRGIYPLGIRRIELTPREVFLIARPEKALSDRLWRVKGLHGRSDVEDYLRSIRFDMSPRRYSQSFLRRLARMSRKPLNKHLVDILAELRPR